MKLQSYIQLSNQPITIEEVRKLIEDYQLSVRKTGEQLDYPYEKKAFPYSVLSPDQQGDRNLLYLSSDDPDYRLITIGIGEAPHPGMKGTLTPIIELTLTQSSTFADKGKANELAKYMAKKLQGELQLFNGRKMHFHPSK